MGGDETVRSFRTGDTDITIQVQNPAVVLKYPDILLYFLILVLGDQYCAFSQVRPHALSFLNI